MPMPLSSDKLHLTMTKSSTFSGLRDALLAVTTFPAAENTLSDFELAAGTGKTILTRCERSVKYTLQLSWFTLPKTRPEPDPEPGLLTITRPEPDPKSKSATRQALVMTWKCKEPPRDPLCSALPPVCEWIETELIPFLTFSVICKASVQNFHAWQLEKLLQCQARTGS